MAELCCKPHFWGLRVSVFSAFWSQSAFSANTVTLQHERSRQPSHGRIQEETAVTCLNDCVHPLHLPNSWRGIVQHWTLPNFCSGVLQKQLQEEFPVETVEHASEINEASNRFPCVSLSREWSVAAQYMPRCTLPRAKSFLLSPYCQLVVYL